MLIVFSTFATIGALIFVYTAETGAPPSPFAPSLPYDIFSHECGSEQASSWPGYGPSDLPRTSPQLSLPPPPLDQE
jgi:hypothetical protein